MATVRKPGPLGKGDRAPMHVRVPRTHREVYEAAAAQAGYSSLSDYVAAKFAELHDLEVPEYVHRRSDPGQLALPA